MLVEYLPETESLLSLEFTLDRLLLTTKYCTLARCSDYYSWIEITTQNTFATFSLIVNNMV